jgi:hypothetical protein
MNHYATQWIDDWCQENGWSDWFVERSRYWGFPPNAVMPLPIPRQALRTIKAQHGMCFQERIWCLSAVGATIAASVSSYFTSSPMPLVVAFAFCALVMAYMEDEEPELS